MNALSVITLEQSTKNAGVWGRTRARSAKSTRCTRSTKRLRPDKLKRQSVAIEAATYAEDEPECGEGRSSGVRGDWGETLLEFVSTLVGKNRQ